MKDWMILLLLCMCAFEMIFFLAEFDQYFDLINIFKPYPITTIFSHLYSEYHSYHMHTTNMTLNSPSIGYLNDDYGKNPSLQVDDLIECPLKFDLLDKSNVRTFQVIQSNSLAHFNSTICSKLMI